MSPLPDSRKHRKNQVVMDSTSKVVSPSLSPAAQNDPDLNDVLLAWPNLPAALRVGIVAMVRAAKRP
jgi:hypothetical protein